MSSCSVLVGVSSVCAVPWSCAIQPSAVTGELGAAGEGVFGWVQLGWVSEA